MLGTSTSTQEIEEIKKGVVKVTATRDGKRAVGTGIIIRVESNGIYIVTASYVVEGTQKIDVEFFVKRNQPVPARTLNLEVDDPNGLAALVVEESIPLGLLALNLSASLSADGGDSVTTMVFHRISMFLEP